MNGQDFTTYRIFYAYLPCKAFPCIQCSIFMHKFHNEDHEKIIMCLISLFERKIVDLII